MPIFQGEADRVDPPLGMLLFQSHLAVGFEECQFGHVALLDGLAERCAIAATA